MKQLAGHISAPNESVFGRTIALHIFSFAAGLLLSRASVFDGALPFGTAAVAGVRREYAPAAAFGAIVGSIFTVNGAPSMLYMGAALFALLLKWALCSLLLERAALCSSLAAAIGSAACSLMGLIAFGGGDAAEYIVRAVVELLLGSGSAYFICIAAPLLNSGRVLSRLTVQELCSAAVAAAVALAALAPYTLFSVSFARIAASLLILCAARYGKETAGGVCGVVFGFAMSIVGGDMYFIVGAYALGGLIAGVFSRSGGAMCRLGFGLGIVTASLSFYSMYNITPVIVETAVSIIIFSLLPRSAHSALGDLFAPAPQLARVDGLRRSMVMRMEFAAAALGDVSDTVEQVAERLSDKNMPTTAALFAKTEQQSCAGCGLRVHCFESSRERTLEAFARMIRLMQKKGRLSSDDYPEQWVSRCLSPDVVAENLYANFVCYESRRQAELRIRQIREVVSDQMQALSDMLKSVAVDLSEAQRYDTAAAEQIDTALRELGIQATDVSCRTDVHRRMTVEICASPPPAHPVSRLEVMKRVSRVCARRFSPPCIVNGGSRLLITLAEQANYRVAVGVAQISCKNERLCGDSYSYFDDGKGKTVMILSDGMGCGGRAAVDSAMVSRLLGRLLKAGFGPDCALGLINSAMLFKSTDESLATVDVSVVDLFSGQADFYKAGAPETLVRRGSKIGRAACKSFPAGILRSASFDKSCTLLSRGNILLMTSDGVISEDGWLDELLLSHRRASAQQLAEQIAQAALRHRNDGHEDDITVMVGVLESAI